MLLCLELVTTLLLILGAALIFTNALEHLGDRLGISAGVTGSIFAAVGTALPETIVPLLAIFAGTSNTAADQDIGVGAILGAPLMLSTLSVFMMAFAVLRKRGMRGYITPERTGLVRDLHFFLVAYCLAGAALFVPVAYGALRILIGLVLVGWYLLYLLLTVRMSTHLVKGGHGVSPTEPLYLARFGLPTSRFSIILKMLLGLVLLVASAEGFIYSVVAVAAALNFSVLVLSLLIIPIATELPEKVNSIHWVRERKDTLAVGNITGAMVFQGSVLPAFGIIATPWASNQQVVAGMLITFAAALWLRLMVTSRGLPLLAFGVNGCLYLLYLALAFV
jgi:cation:H+ antiporter